MDTVHKPGDFEREKCAFNILNEHLQSNVLIIELMCTHMQRRGTSNG
jgi:hypothetical protein